MAWGRGRIRARGRHRAETQNLAVAPPNKTLTGPALHATLGPASQKYVRQ